MATLSATNDEIGVPEERVTSGVAELAVALRGRSFRGSSVLITGAPGTAKSTLAGTFVEAACRRGERAVLFVLDEAAQKMVRNLRSVGVDLRPHFDADRLRIVRRRAGAVGAEQHLLVMEGEIEDFAPARVAVDPLSALSVAQRLILLIKSAGITLLAGQNPEVGSAPLQVSTRADTWIHLRYDVHAGERNPTLSIVKSRGTGHSNQVRELVLSDASITLKEVYVAGREVLTGTMRQQGGLRQAYEREMARAEAERRQHELSRTAVEAEA
jgi:circadian clock protein KaiC